MLRPSLAVYSTLRFHPWGAPDVLCAKVASRVLNSGGAVFLAVRSALLEHPEMAALRRAGAEIRHVPELVRGGKLTRLAAFVRNARTGASRTLPALRRFRPSFVLINQGGFYDFLGEEELFRWLRAERIPYALLAHSNHEIPPLGASDRYRALEIIGGATKLFGVSRFQLDLAERQLLSRISNSDLIQNPIELPATLPLPWPALPQPTFASVARLDAHGKGLDILLPALRQSPGLKCDWRLNVYGAGPDREYLESLAAWCGLRERVVFHGHVADKGRIWSENHMLLLPSRWEGSPQVVIEALLCGRPVLRTNYGGAAEWMHDGVSGFLCPAAEQSLLEQTLAVAWSRRGDWPALGRAGHAHAASVAESDPAKKILALLDSSICP